MSATEQVERLCEVMHDAYEEAAAKAGWETQERSRKPWAEVPEANKTAMRQAVFALVGHLMLNEGFRPPTRTVSTVEERDALFIRVSEAAEAAHVQDARRRDWLITEDEDGRFWAWSYRMEDEKRLAPVNADELLLPLTVLHEGGEPRA